MCSSGDPRAGRTVGAVSAVAGDLLNIWDQPGEGGLRYIANSRCAQDGLPPGASLGRVSAVVTLPDGRIAAFHRGTAIEPVVLFDAATATAVASWNAGIGLAHGMRVGPDGHLWLTDVARHQVVKVTVDGEV